MFPQTQFTQAQAWARDDARQGKPPRDMSRENSQVADAYQTEYERHRLQNTGQSIFRMRL